MKRITDTELLELSLGSMVRIIWHNSIQHPKNYEVCGIIFGDKIGYEDNSIDHLSIIAGCMRNDKCMVYLLTDNTEKDHEIEVSCDINKVIEFLQKKKEEGYKRVELIDNLRAEGWVSLQPKLKFIVNNNEPTVLGIKAIK